jgi:hypothetical protein
MSVKKNIIGEYLTAIYKPTEGKQRGNRGDTERIQRGRKK